MISFMDQNLNFNLKTNLFSTLLCTGHHREKDKDFGEKKLVSIHIKLKTLKCLNLIQTRMLIRTLTQLHVILKFYFKFEKQ